MYNYAGFNELGYLIIIIEEEIPIVGGSGAGKGFKRKTHYLTIEDEYYVDATVIKVFEDYYKIIGNLYKDYSYFLAIEGTPSKENSKAFDISGVVHSTEKQILVTSACVIEDKFKDYEVGCRLYELFTASYDLKSDNSRTLDFSCDIDGVGWDNKENAYLCYCNLFRTQELAYEIKGRKNTESLLDLLLMDIKG